MGRARGEWEERGGNEKGRRVASGGDGTSTTLSGVISGTGGIIKNGAGTLRLSGVNTYTGGTTINGGTISVSADSALGNTFTAALKLNGGTLKTTASFGMLSRAVTLSGAGGTFDVNTGTNIQEYGLIGGTGGLSKVGGGFMTLGNVNTY